MEKIVCLVFTIICLQADVHSAFLADRLEDLTLPDFSHVECAPRGQSIDVLVFNKVEIVNNLQRYSLGPLLSHRGIMPEDNPDLNNYLRCVWEKEHFLIRNGDLNYDKFESVIKDAIVKTVGSTGPAIQLSMVHAKQIMDECRAIKESNAGNRMAKVQNHIVKKLQPFAEI